MTANEAPLWRGFFIGLAFSCTRLQTGFDPSVSFSCQATYCRPSATVGSWVQKTVLIGLASCAFSKASLRRQNHLKMPIPTSIATTKTPALGSPMPSATKPGPGAKACNAPADSEERAAPDESAVDLFVFWKQHRRAEVRHGTPASHRKCNQAHGDRTEHDEGSDGSQAPAKSRKPSTFAGSTMPESMRPRPKTKPAISAVKFFIRLFRYRGRAEARTRLRSRQP